MPELKLSRDVAAMFGMPRTRLNTILTRHPELKPAGRLEVGGFSAYQWTEAEIEALRQYLDSIAPPDTVTIPRAEYEMLLTKAAAYDSSQGGK